MHSNKRQKLSHTGSGSDNPKPQLTRACAECKKLKIKCFIQPGQTACNKCLKNGVHCVPHNFAQKFMDEDADWKSRTDANMQKMRSAIEQLLKHNNLPSLDSLDCAPLQPQPTPGAGDQHPTQNPSPLTTDHSHSSLDPAHGFLAEGPSSAADGPGAREDDSDLVPLPMNNLYNLADPTKSSLIRIDSSSVNGPDLISQGLLSLADAEALFDYYRDHINPLLWDGMLCSHATLRDARRSSPLLVAVVLTVAALHIPDRERQLHATYGAFVALMRGSCLLRCQNLDIIRALCIGAFYLTSLSWALSSRAVRLATEMNLHKSSLQFARGPSLGSPRERVRLWYVLYVCDHQFALAYGRPPLMHEDAAIRNAERLLDPGQAVPTRGDRGLVTQVRLFRILASGYFTHGCDPDLELRAHDFEKLQSFNISVDQWRLEHQAGIDGSGGALLPKGNTLYYHLARFQLNSVALRGISARDASGLSMNWDRQEAANNAIISAMSTARLIIDDAPLQRALVGLPIFAHAMIAVCASFLLKMAVVFGEPAAGSASDDRKLRLPRDLAQFGLNFHTKMALTNVQTLVGVLGRVADNASQGHVARQVVTGLRELLQRFSPGEEVDSFVYAQPGAGGDVLLPAAGPEGRLQRDDVVGFGQPPACLPGEGQAGDGMVQTQDPFDMAGDLDWRFDEGFLWGIDTMNFSSQWQ
ncbi:hypothetical protein B0T11DRAFT_314702 [Plectosphaerella cucumerina]|uniref:Zn(2)-C6 fungal-type domain-containing protein n=1 Tax=Plectosphaerella cucumerina TaxID=40658 RepID=A0A8K0TQ56_9PEZI|nr:hypothetical protein B0T11DRAFT_314702 [Plectosphaerella cucumerina]